MYVSHLFVRLMMEGALELVCSLCVFGGDCALALPSLL